MFILIIASGKHIIYKTVLGDMYVTDMNRTKGHKSLLNYGCWNPSLNSEEFMTCADDCTLRLWSLNKRDQQLHVIRTKGESGRDVRTTTCTYNQSLYHNENSNLIAAGCDNGSILVWDRRRSFVHVTFKCLNAHLQDESITSLKWSYDSQILASRSTDHTLKLWDIRKFNKCLSSYENIPNHFSMTNISFSPNDKFVITGVSKLMNSSDNDAHGKLIIFDRNDLSKPLNEILFNDSVIRTSWHPKLNQIFTTTNNGLIRIFYDEKRSPMAGVRLCLERKERKGKYTNDFVANIDPIRTSNCSSDDINVTREILPENKEEENQSSSFHQHIIQTIVKSNFIEKEDPRVELLKHAKEAERNPKWVTPAYVHTQPKPIFQQQLDEEDEEDFLPVLKKQRKH
jgi:WD40 repeat protein